MKIFLATLFTALGAAGAAGDPTAASVDPAAPEREAAQAAPGDPAAGPTTSLYAAVEAGQLVAYKYRQEDFQYAWRHRAYLDYSTHYAYGERFKVDMGLGGFLWFNTFPKQRNTDRNNFDVKHVSLFISNALGSYAFGDPARPYLTASAGVFPYKYDPEARNLGEYLFRTGAYPNFILGDFDFALARLTGFKLSSAWFPRWKNDLILNMETDIWPHFDWNASYVTSYDFGPALTVGAGVSFTNVISVDKDKTSPKNLTTMYVTNLHSDSAVLPGTDIKYEIIVGDTGYYTFQSTKLMLRFAFNPSAFFHPDWLGPNDLRLYGEAAILGLKDYPRPTPTDTVQINSFFTDRFERMPVMVGFNLPAFKLLDVLALEVEWYGLKGPNSFQQRKEGQAPMPQQVNAWQTSRPDQTLQYYYNQDYQDDDWKWSLYAKKSLQPGCDLVAQVARDHVRHDFDSPVQLDREEALTRPGQWWWAAKIQFYR